MTDSASSNGNGNDTTSQTVTTVEQAVTTGTQAAQAIEQVASSDGSLDSVVGAAGSAAGVAGSVAGVATAVSGASRGVHDAFGAVSTVASLAQTAGSAFHDIAHAVQSIAEAMQPRIATVHFAFACENTNTAWSVAAVSHVEALDAPYVCTVELATSELHGDPETLLGYTCTVTMDRGGPARRIVGIARHVEETGTTARDLLARVEIVPVLWTLTQHVRSQIFEDLDAVEIITAVLDERLKPYARRHRWETQRRFARREYCVQYHESDFDFVQRLLEEEGVSYRFEFTGDTETLVFVDGNAAYPDVHHNAGDREIAVLGPEGDTSSVESIRQIRPHTSMQSTSVLTRDHDWTQPALDLQWTAPGEDLRGRDRAIETYADAVIVGGYDKGDQRYRTSDVRQRAVLHRERNKVRERRFLGTGNVTAFVPGSVFELTGHLRDDMNASYVLVRVEHHGAAREVLDHDTADDRHPEQRYRNTFECIPHQVEHRPQRTVAKRRVPGPQTATVVAAGDTDDEIHVDEHGRIRVRFHWDAATAQKGLDGRYSCWVRVAQAWAGNQWGFVFTPRVGMEVIVTFLQGDPDRPLVTGTVYNGTNRTPYDLPEHKTRSAIRTRTTPGGEGWNEIRFEDARHNEELYLRAQKDMNTLVQHDQGEHVKRNRSRQVDGDQTVQVHGHDKLHVVGGQRVTVEGLQQVNVEADAHGAHGDQTITVANNHALGVGGTGTIDVKGALRTTQGDGDLITLTFEGGEATLEAAHRIVLKVGQSTIEILADGVTIQSPTVMLKSARAESIVALDASGVVVRAPRTAVLSGSSQIAVTDSSVGIGASEVNLSTTGGATVGLAGPNVRLNG